MIKNVVNKIPEFCMSHWLFRIPLAIVFLQQGFSKLPVTMEGAESFDLPYMCGGLQHTVRSVLV